MRKGTKALLITGLCILGAGIIACIIAFALNGFKLWRNPIPSGDTQQRSEEMHEIISDSFSDISIELITSTVDIKKSSSSECRLDYTYTPVANNSQIECKVENGTLIFRHSYDSDNFKWWNISMLWEKLSDLIYNGSISDENSRLVLYLPEKKYGRLDIDLTTGNINNDPELIFREVYVDLTTGNISLNKLQIPDKLDLSVVTGNINVSDTSAAALKISVTTGDVVLNGINSSGQAQVSMVTGDISITNSVLKDADIEATTTDIYLENLEADTLKASTVTGDVTGKIASDINVQCNTTSGKISAPSGNRCFWEITTVSGDIELQSISN